MAVRLEPGRRLAVPVLFPGVVIGLGEPGRDEPGDVDIALTCGSDPPAPWVTVPDPEAALQQLAGRVAGAPLAATGLAQVLRLGRGRPVDEGLAIESLTYSTLQAGPEFGAWRAGRADPLSPQQEAEPVLVERREDRLLITLNRPHVHNAYNRATRDSLYAALTVAALEPGIRVEITGRGPSFCSGGDLTEFGAAPDPATAHRIRTGRSPARLLATMADRVTATLHGACAGSGIELPAFAGTVVARPDTAIWLPELSMGLIPGAGGTVSLARRIGPSRTAWLGLSGERIDAVSAHRWGLVDRLLET